MPIFEYACKKCHHCFEELVFGRDEKVGCPACGSKRVKKAMSVFSFSSGGEYRSSAGSSCGSCAKHSCSGCSHG